MQFTLIGFILVPLSLVLAVVAPQGIAYMLVAFTAFSATAVINLTGVTFGLQPAHLLSALLALLFLAGAFRIPRTGHSAAVAALLSGFLVAILLSILSRAIREEVVLSHFTQAAIAANGLVTAALVAFFCSTRKRLVTALEVFVWSAVFVSAWGLYQALCGNVGLSYPDWLFNNSISESADLFSQDVDGMPRISSVAVEPSFFGRYSVSAAAIALAMAEFSAGRRRGAYFAAAALITVAAVVSTSTSAYVGLALLFALWIALDVRRLFGVAFAGAGAGFLLALLQPHLLAAAWEMTGRKTASGSFYERFGSVVVALRHFGEHPLFGHGWEELASYDLFAALLYHVGIVGWLTFFTLMAYALVGGPARSGAGARAPVSDGGLSRLSIGLRVALVCILGMDAVSGISYVAANLWVVLGLTLAAQGLEREENARDETGRPAWKRVDADPEADWQRTSGKPV